MDKSVLYNIIKTMRPKQWTKNALVLAAYIFASGDKTQSMGMPMFWNAIFATLFFCLASSSVYIINDVRDCEQDQQHPEKRKRPIASGNLNKRVALLFSAALAGSSLVAAFLLSENLAYILAGYFGLQLVYTFLLKQVELVDVFVIAAGFVLRAIGGAVVIGSEFSPWLLLCASLLALFLALCKRRHEKLS